MSSLATELRFPAMEEPLSWRIMVLHIFCDDDGVGFGVVSGEDTGRCFCGLCSGSGGRVKASVEGGGATAICFGVLSIAGGGGMSFVWPLLCERVGLFGISVGFRGRAASVAGGGGVAFPTSVGQLTVVNLSSSPLLLKMAADVLSSFTMCFGLGAGSRLLWQQNFTPLRRIGGGPCLAVSRLLRRTEGRRRGAPAALGSVWWLGIAACNFLFL